MSRVPNPSFTRMQALYYAASRSAAIGIGLYAFANVLSAITGDRIASQWMLGVGMVSVSAYIFAASMVSLLWFLPAHNNLVSQFLLSPLWPQQAGYRVSITPTVECSEFLKALESLLQRSFNVAQVQYSSGTVPGFVCHVPMAAFRLFGYQLRVDCDPQLRAASISVTSYEPKIFNYLYQPIDVAAARTLVTVVILSMEHELIEREFDETLSPDQLRKDLGSDASTVESYLHRLPGATSNAVPRD